MVHTITILRFGKDKCLACKSVREPRHVRWARASSVVVAMIIGLALSPFFSERAHATCPSFHTLTNGTTADATEVMDNFNYILGCPNFTGNVGIGTATPSRPLDVTGNAKINTLRIGEVGQGTDWPGISNNALGDVGGQYALIQNASGQTLLNSASGQKIGFRVGDSEKMTLLSDGTVGIGTTSPDPNWKVTVNGGLLTQNGGSIWSDGTVAFVDNGTAGSSLCYNDFVGTYHVVRRCTSLAKFKNNQQTLTFGLETLMKLHPVEFDWDAEHGGKHDLGFIAEEVEKVNPILAEYSDGKLISVKYRQMTALLAKSVQEQQHQIEQLKANDATKAADIDALKADASSMKEELDLLKAQNAELMRRLASLEQHQHQREASVVTPDR